MFSIWLLSHTPASCTAPPPTSSVPLLQAWSLALWPAVLLSTQYLVAETTKSGILWATFLGTKSYPIVSCWHQDQGKTFDLINICILHQKIKREWPTHSIQDTVRSQQCSPASAMFKGQWKSQNCHFIILRFLKVRTEFYMTFIFLQFLLQCLIQQRSVNVHD